jgi:hypothetical protein
MGGTGGVDPADPPVRLLVGPREPRDDQLAFCAALYEALVGVLPPEGATAESVALAAAGGEVRPIGKPIGKIVQAPVTIDVYHGSIS